MLHSICQQIWKAKQWSQDWKMSVFIPTPKKGSAKGCSYYCTIALISNSNKVMLKILQAKLQEYVYHKIIDIQAGFKKAEEPEINCQHPLDHWKSKRVPGKHLLLLYWLWQSLWVCGSQKTGKLFVRWEYQTTLLPPEKSIRRPRSNS